MENVENSVRRPRSFSNVMLDTAAVSVLFVAVTFVSGIVISRTLGPEGRGFYGTLQFYAQNAAYFFAFSMFEAAIVRLREEKLAPADALPDVALLTAMGGLILFLVAMGLFVFDALHVGGTSSLTAVVFVVTSAAALMITRMFGAIDGASLNFGRMNFERIVTPIIFVLSVLAVSFAGYITLEAVLFLFVGSHFPMMVVWAWRFRRSLRFDFNRKRLRSIFSLGLRLYAASFPMAIALQADKWFPIALWTAGELGQYFVAYSAVGIGISLALQAVRMVLFPNLAGLPQEVRKARIEQAVRILLIVAVGFAAVIFFAAPILIPLAYGDEFAGAVRLTQALAFAVTLGPVRIAIELGTRAKGLSRPGFEMAVALAAVFGLGYLLTGYSKPEELFVFIFLADGAAVLLGVYRLRQEDSLSARALIPRLSDLKFLINKARDYINSLDVRRLLKRLRARPSKSR